MKTSKKLPLTIYIIVVLFSLFRLISQTFSQGDGIVIVILLVIGIILDISRD